MPINTKKPGDCGYVAFYGSRRIELYASGLWPAKEAAIAYFKPPKSKQHLVTVVLAEDKDGAPVTHTPDF